MTGLPTSLQEPMSAPSQAGELNGSDLEDFRVSFERRVTPTVRVYRNGILEPCSVSDLLAVLIPRARAEGMRIPRDPVDLIRHFPHLEITDTNIQSEHLFVIRDFHVVNVATYLGEVREGRDPAKSSNRWIAPSEAYRHHNLSCRANCSYIPPGYRPPKNPIRDLIENSLNDQATAALFHYLVAAMIIGYQPLKAVVLIVALKHAGKSLLLNLLTRMLGGYSLTLSPSDLLPSNETRLAKELFANHGKRFLRIDELMADSYINEAMVKRITGRDGIANPFVTHPTRTFHPQTRLFFGTNAPLRPQLGNESTIEDRLMYFPYGKAVPLDQRDPFLEEKLATEENFDAYFSFLVDTYLAKVAQGVLP